MIDDNIEVQEAKVTYSTKELLQRIDHRFDKLELLAENSATRGEVEALAHRVGVLETDASGTKAVAKALLDSDKGRWSKNEKIAGLLLASIAIAPTFRDLVSLFQ